jgi:hypothetical protein
MFMLYSCETWPVVLREGPGGVLTMLYGSRYWWVFGLCPSSGVLKNTKEHNIEGRGARAGFYDPPLIHTYIHTYIRTKNTIFRTLDLFPFSGAGGGETPALFGPIERANPNYVCPGRWMQSKNTLFLKDRGCFRARCWGEYLDPRGIK